MPFTLKPASVSSPQPVAVPWLWPPYLAAGKLAILDGDPGCGKSLLTIDLAARRSRGRPLPGGHAAGVCRTLLLNAEDDPADTILPRLRAADADLDQVFVSEGDELPRFPGDLPRLETLARERGVDLMVVDSLSAFLPAELAGGQIIAVRQVLAPLAQFAARNRIAVLLVRRLVKRPNAKPLYRGVGSIGIAGLARTVLLAERHPRDPDCQVLRVLKSNLAAPPAPLGYRLVDRAGVGGVEWLSAAELPAGATGPPPKVEVPGVVRATVWLLEALADGPRPAAELLVAAKAADIREFTLEHAKRQLKIASKVGHTPEGRRCWLWCPPPEPMPSILDPLEPVEMEDLHARLSGEGEAVLNRDKLAWAARVLRGR
ncbi:MAG: AAA family ATPase [Gemmataceae bacterium]